MSDGGKTQRPGAPAPVQETPAQQNALPTVYRSVDPSRSVGPARFDGIREERQAAGEQIQRSLKAWRAASGAGGAQTGVPKGSGAPLPSTVRSRMEPKLGADLSSVRVPTSGESADGAKGFGARAFTVGSDVHFNAGQFQPGTKEGDKLIAHELTHVVQGQKSGVQRSPDPEAEGGGKDAGGDKEGGADAKGGGAEVSDPSEPAEKEADATGDKVGEELHADGEKGGGGEEKAHGGEKAGGEKKDAKGGGKDKKGGDKEKEKEKEKEKKGGADAKGGDKKGGDDAKGEKGGDDKGGDAAADAKGGDAKGGDAKGGDAKGGDAKGGDAKGGDAGGDAKGGDAGGAKAEEKPAPIAAKLEGVARKVFLTKAPTAPAPAGGQPGAAGGAKPATPAAADPAPVKAIKETVDEVGGNKNPIEIAPPKVVEATESDSPDPIAVKAKIEKLVADYLDPAKAATRPAALEAIKAGMAELRDAMSAARGEKKDIVKSRTTFEHALGAMCVAGTDGFAGADATVNAMVASAMSMIAHTKSPILADGMEIDATLKELAKDDKLKAAVEAIGIDINKGYAGAAGTAFDSIEKALTAGSLTEKCTHLINFGDEFLKKQVFEGTKSVLDDIKANLKKLGSPTDIDAKIKAVQEKSKDKDHIDKEAGKGLMSTGDFTAKVNAGGPMDSKTPQQPVEALDDNALKLLAKQKSVKTVDDKGKPLSRDQLLAALKKAGVTAEAKTGAADMTEGGPGKTGDNIEKEAMPYIQGIQANMVNPKHQWIKAAAAADMPLKAGISGTTHRFLGLGELLGVANKEGMRLAMLGHLQAIEAHSFWEICDATALGPPIGKYVPFKPVDDGAMAGAAKKTLVKDPAFGGLGPKDQDLQVKRLLGTDK